MLDDIEILKDMFKEHALEQLECRQEGTHDIYSVRLKEPQDKYFVMIDKMSNHDEAIVINPEAFVAPMAIFKGSKGECKRADFVIIDAKEKFIIYIEMKRTKNSRKGIKQQLAGAECFIAYCKEIGRTFWGNEKFLDAYQQRFVTINRINNRDDDKKKRIPITVSTNNTVVHDRPEKMLRIPHREKLRFEQLV
jgi:hypothetical protein